MTKLMTALAVLSLALLGLNCDKDSESPESAIPEKYIGTWKASITVEGTLIEYAPQSNPESGVDLRSLGAEITATLNKDGSYSLTFKDPIEGEDTDQGKVVIDEENNTLLLDSNAGADNDIPFAFEWQDNNTLILITLTEFDFTLQGNEPVPAIVTVILKRSS
jgi:hypothetical protein